MKKDNVKDFTGLWSAEKLQPFLSAKPSHGHSADYNAIMHAYRHMPADVFEQFVHVFEQSGGDVNATNANGKTAREVIGEHSQGQAYVAAF